MDEPKLNALIAEAETEAVAGLGGESDDDDMQIGNSVNLEMLQPKLINYTVEVSQIQFKAFRKAGAAAAGIIKDILAADAVKDALKQLYKIETKLKDDETLTVAQYKRMQLKVEDYTLRIHETLNSDIDKWVVVTFDICEGRVGTADSLELEVQLIKRMNKQ